MLVCSPDAVPAAGCAATQSNNGGIMTDYYSIVLIFAMILLMLLVMAIWWNLESGNDRATTWYAIATIAVFFFFVWVQNQAEREHELKHAVEKSVVQEQVEAVREF